ncbi:MAG: terminase [Muribaculaceae bacterium]|nr:terminase [Muribaculaceae bacterium]
MVEALLAENARRNALLGREFDPVTGFGSVGERVLLELPDWVIPRQWIPKAMDGEPLVRRLRRAGSIRGMLGKNATRGGRKAFARLFTALRMKHDFPFWAASLVKVKRKGGGDDVPFVLNRPQRRFVERLERARCAGRPVRLILLKARQWGGSTCSQLYMAWLQLVHCRGLNSLIIAHQGAGSDEIKDMFDRMMRQYPARLLTMPGETRMRPGTRKMERVGKSGSIVRVGARNCKVKIGTAERPDSCRGGDYNLVHLSEVGIWRATDGKQPEDIVRAACAGVLLRPMTMIVYESTANGTGNFFHREYEAARKGESQFEAMFVGWYDVEGYTLPLEDPRAFAASLIEGRNSDAETARSVSGRYLWSLWEKGATLEGLNWYVAERAKYNDHAQMAAEYPSDDVEAFAHSGMRVFDPYCVEKLRAGCRAPLLSGELEGLADSGADALRGLTFHPDARGSLHIWEKPDVVAGERMLHRYLVVVDIGGRSLKSDWSVIAVFDRLLVGEGGRPAVVAQWRGHCDIDLVAWRAARIARWYDDALLVIESNTLETREYGRMLEGDQSGYILSQVRDVYPNLYERPPSEEDIRQGAPAKYGFHTNASTKPMIISGLVRDVREGLYIERDEECLDEMLRYERRPNGSYGAIQGAHDDLVMTRAIGLHISSTMPLPRTVRHR